jgi:hypothetical protein
VDALETYFSELSANRAAGSVPETSGYGALANLLNEVGHKLKPRLRCVVNPANSGAGIPDGGLFVANQFEKGQTEPLPGQLPARGAVEAKAPSADAHLVAQSDQVLKYLAKYRQVLVTTYREFVLVGYDAEGEAGSLESFSLAGTEIAFWALATTPRKSAMAHGERLAEFLRRVMLRPVPIVAPQELAWFLASYAREARARVEEGGGLPALSLTRTALEESLGMTFQGERGEHFFRSTLVQTLFYGLFAAWVFWSEHHVYTDTQARFRWREAAQYLRIPILQKLFWDFANPTQLGALRLDEVLDWAAEALNRVDRVSFFATFEQQHAVQYFYEPFLEAFDPDLRKQLGVWYTPPEIVHYMVARVDQVLRSELDIADGLADPRVVVLDPCCGTGAYLVEVLDKIAAILREKGGDGLLANDLKQAAMNRIFGFEILPAPFVISHLQIGLALDRFGAPLAENGNERAGVYLTNALTGWEPPSEPKQHLLFHEMEEERDKAEAVKQHQPILVILGNPPYNGFAGVSPDEEEGLLDPYKEGLREWGITKNYLDDLYVRFLRLAERRIARDDARGVVCFITNFSYLASPSFVTVRSRLLAKFDRLWFDCLNGDSRETGKLTPTGEPDPSVFSTEHNREGIRVGTAVGLMVRKSAGSQPRQGEVLFRELWGADKRQRLLQSLDDGGDDAYELVEPRAVQRYSFRPALAHGDYLDWPRIPDLSASPGLLGLNENRGQSLYALDRVVLENRFRAYFDPGVPFDNLAQFHPALVCDAASFDAKHTRARLLAESAFDEDNVRRMWFKPFDLRWGYVERTASLWNRVRPELLTQCRAENRFLLVRCKAPKTPDGSIFLLTNHLSDQHALQTDAYFFPTWLESGNPKKSKNQDAFEALSDSSVSRRANLSRAARSYLADLGVKCLDSEPEEASLIWLHAASIGYSTKYISENVGALRQDWPRIPLPALRETLLDSAHLGRHIAALLDVDSAVDRVTTGHIRYELRPVGPIAKADDGQVNPAAGDLAVTVGWGHAGQGSVTMPGHGRLVERAYAADELAAFREGLSVLDLTYEQLMACLGGTCVDVYLNDLTHWRCVPKRVWVYTIGGYQVIKKWLSYRERPLLGRDLSPEEARYVTEMARRIAAILLLEPALDDNYERVKTETYVWPHSAATVR